MAESERNWAPPKWVKYDKHRPPPGLSWKALVKATGEPESAALYHPSVTLELQEKMEIACVRPQNLFATRGHKRMYFMDMGYIIGASAGSPTTLIYVEHLTNGQVHGRPVTVNDLRRLGARI